MSPRKRRLCILCGLLPAEVPDRETTSRALRVCQRCHWERLADDIRGVLATYRRRAAASRDSWGALLPPNSVGGPTPGRGE